MKDLCLFSTQWQFCKFLPSRSVSPALLMFTRFTWYQTFTASRPVATCQGIPVNMSSISTGASLLSQNDYDFLHLLTTVPCRHSKWEQIKVSFWAQFEINRKHFHLLTDWKQVKKSIKVTGELLSHAYLACIQVQMCFRATSNLNGDKLHLLFVPRN